jgi:hypothetical protein
VEVVAFGSNGKFLGAPNVTLFESEDRRDIARRFQRGIAENVPFGVYRIRAFLPGFYSCVRYAAVYQRRTTVVLGLEPGYEASPGPLRLSGRVVGQRPSAANRSFVKLTGVFSSLSVESAIGPDGRFELSGMEFGTYLLLVVGEDGVLASRLVRLPGDGPTVQVEIGRDRVTPVR